MATHQLQDDKNTEFLYRYDTIKYSLGINEFDESLPGYRLVLHLWEYPIIKRTPKGVWISSYSFKKFVLLYGRKRFAWPTKEEALFSFQKRKEAQIRILTSQLKTAEEALRLSNCEAEKQRSGLLHYDRYDALLAF
jgi:hypothetical protein